MYIVHQNNQTSYHPNVASVSAKGVAPYMPRGRGLTRENILKEAFSIIDSEGSAAFTMRLLAQRLGVANMAVYNHYRDRDDILDALADKMFSDLSKAAALPTKSSKKNNRETGLVAKSRLRAILLGAHKAASEHPHIYRLAMSRPNKPATAFQVTIEALDSLKQIGLSDGDALTAYHTFLMLLQGFPFWQEGFENTPESFAKLCAKSPGAYFHASVDWLLKSLDQLKDDQLKGDQLKGKRSLPDMRRVKRPLPAANPTSRGPRR